MSLVIALKDEAAREPAVAGGKAAALARLSGTDLPIPPGFVVTTAAYDRFVAVHGLDEAITSLLARTDLRNPAAAESASASIRGLFRAHPLAEDLATATTMAWDHLGRPPVAVRSSATAEDLPGLSFAGQQESFLNVSTEADLLRAVIDCWSSLWTARAIAYRARKWDPAATARRLSIAVLVQTMVPADYAGVLFTANPVTGERDEMVMEAVAGLGDALVSGQVAPQRFIIRDGHGDPVEPEARDTVPEAVVRDVARLGLQVAARLPDPQDIEWAWSLGTAFLVQSRPITSLYPLPDATGEEPRCYVSFGAIQGMLDPMTPLGRDTIGGIFAGAANLLGLDVTWKTQRVLKTAGERLWIDVTRLLRNPIGRRLMGGVLSFVEPRTGEVIREAVTPAGVKRPPIGLRTVIRIPRVAIPMAARFVAALLFPDWSRRRAERHLERFGAGSNGQPDGGSARSTAPVDPAGPAPALALLTAVGRDAFPTLIPHVVPRIAAGVICQRAIGRLTAGLPDSASAALFVSRGLPHNVTADMNRRLWQIAQQVRRQPQVASLIAGATPPELAASLHRGALPPEISVPMAGFIEAYGSRGLAEIDLGRPRWREDPEPLFQTLQAYLRMSRPPAEAEAETAGRDAMQRLTDWSRALQRRRLLVHAWLLRFCFRRYRALGGIREGPKFSVMRRLGPVRWQLQRVGAALVVAGWLDSRDDIFFLHVDELLEDDAGSREGWRDLVRSRREAYGREHERRQVPLVLLSSGRAFHGGAGGDEDGSLRGTPVSPGLAEGAARVLDSPTSSALEPGEILVCRGTDPAWTPLFLTAGGLITEVGGVMSHGAVVAREYGIPAVVGVPGATERLRTGQRVRVDGASGRVAVLGD